METRPPADSAPSAHCLAFGARRLATTLAVAIALLAPPGCASSGSQPAVVFPSQDEVANIPARKARPEAFGTEAVAVDAWTFESLPLPDAAAYEDSSPWGRLLREQVSAHSGTTTLSPPLRCTAQEIARFHLAKNALPAESLRRFIAARCGAVVPALMPAVVSAPVPASMSEEQIAATFRANLATLFDERLRGGHHLVGLAAARGVDRISMATVIAEDESRLEPGSRSVDAKRQVTLRGGVRGEFGEIGALVNRGDYGTAPCVSDGGVRPPQFAIRCELAPSDRFAWVEVIGRRREGVLLHEIAETLIFEGDGSDLAYKARHLAPAAPARTASEATAAIVEGLNRVRRAANLVPLALAPKQSIENARLAGTLVDAMIASDEGVADRTALGLLAGWNVDGLIRNGAFFVGLVAPERDASVWLDFALERPVGRETLLDAEARQIGVGPALPDGNAGLGAVVTTYAFFASDDHSADETHFFDRLAQARAEAGVPDPVRITGFEPMRVECARVMREGKPPMAALGDMMANAAQRTGKAVAGYVLETNDLTRVDVPRQLLARGPLEVIVGVTHHRAPRAAWAQYVVFVIVLGNAPQMTASARSGVRRTASLEETSE
jgi:hypothetical protein